MKKVYVVTRGCYSDYCIMECFDNRKAAKGYITNLEEEDEYYNYHPAQIEVYELQHDNPRVLLEGRYKVEARINDGVIGNAKIIKQGMIPSDVVDTYDGYINRFVMSRKGETKDDFLTRSHKILCDEYYAWKATRGV